VAYHAANVASWRIRTFQRCQYNWRHRVRKLNAEGDFTREEFQALCEKHGNVCFRCGDGDVLLTPDHVIPLSVDGRATE
jgi:5-methylcytosine-specific restriction endonuclease McrA